MANDAIKLDQIPIWHDQKDKYKELENFICVLEEGCSFGELAMAPHSVELVNGRNRNYSAISLSNSLVVSFPRSEFDRVVLKKEREIIESRRVFL